MLLKLDNICKTNAYGSLNKNIFLSIILTNIIYGKEHKQCAYKRNIEMRSLNQCRRVKAIIIIYSECVSGALVMQQAGACAILSSVASLALPHISTLSHKRHDIREKTVIEYEVCFDSRYTFV